MRTFLGELYVAFRRVSGYAVSMVALAAAVLFYIVLPDTLWEARIVIPVGILAFLGLITLADCAYNAVRHSRPAIPRVLRALPAAPPFPDAVAILLLEASPLLAQDTLVSVYTRANDFERYLGVGFVTTIQENGLAQVCVLESDAVQVDDAWQRISANNTDELAQLLVKPSVPRSVLG